MLQKREQTDCFADKQDGRCDILLKKDCSNCSFYKTRQRFEDDSAKVLQRIVSLDETSRVFILEKYSAVKGA